MTPDRGGAEGGGTATTEPLVEAPAAAPGPAALRAEAPAGVPSSPAGESAPPDRAGAGPVDPPEEGRPKFRLGNRPPLTGFRAFALSTVLVYHSNFHTWPGSWIAIQMFFVLSGFLITSMLAAEGDRHGRISLSA